MLTLTRQPRDVARQRNLHQRAKLFRKNPTEAERLLWQALKSRAITNLRIRRQFPIDRYIVDFCCLQKKLVIEVDGPIHQNTIVRDQNRDMIISYYGFKVMRFSNEEVIGNIDSVIHRIKNYLDCSPSLQQGEKDQG